MTVFTHNVCAYQITFLEQFPKNRRLFLRVLMKYHHVVFWFDYNLYMKVLPAAKETDGSYHFVDVWCARHPPKCFMCVILLNFIYNNMKYYYLIPNYRWETEAQRSCVTFPRSYQILDPNDLIPEAWPEDSFASIERYTAHPIF